MNDSRVGEDSRMLLSEAQPSSLTDEQIDQLLLYTDAESVIIEL